MTQPVDRHQIAVTVNGQPIFAARQVAPGQSQPVGELSDGQPVWPVPTGTESRGGPVPFGVTSSGQPVWTQPSATPGPPEQTTITAFPQKGKAARPLYKKKRVLIPAACVVLLGFAAATGDGGSATDTVATSSAPADAKTEEQSAADRKAAADKAAADKAAADKASADKAAADKAAADKAAADTAAADKAAADKAAADKAAADKAAADKAAAAAKGTASQQNAYEKAIDYLDFAAFSRAGLIEQLSSEYGSQFPAADAEFAVNRLEREGEVDWNAEAAEKAKDYLDFSSFSRQGLIDQLTSEYGSQFTLEQAEYGVSQTGL